MNFTKEEKVKFMDLAFAEAQKARLQNEIPIGAVIVNENKEVIGVGYNRRELDQNAVHHAEIIAIQAACQDIDSWRLENCAIFVTLEPCPMCAGAIINSRIEDVYYGANDPKAGAAGSVVNLFTIEKFNHQPNVFPGLFAAKSAQILKKFFQEIRAKKKQLKK